jgi:hypothetical protein
MHKIRSIRDHIYYRKSSNAIVLIEFCQVEIEMLPSSHGKFQRCWLSTKHRPCGRKLKAEVERRRRREKRLAQIHLSKKTFLFCNRWTLWMEHQVGEDSSDFLSDGCHN